jgi:hypothetical protein
MHTQSTSGPQEFASGYASSMRQFAESFFEELAHVCPDENVLWRSEACAALWAATQAVFGSSVLSPGERNDLLREITRNLVPFWQRHCSNRPDASQTPSYRPGVYGYVFAPGNLAAAADSIVAELMRSTGAPRGQTSITERTLSAALAQRMLADLRSIDQYKNGRVRSRRPPRFSTGRATAPANLESC